MSGPRGFGLVAGRLWEIEGGDAAALGRRARAMGLGWILVGLAFDAREIVPRSARPKLVEIVARLHGRGIAVFGWGSRGQAPEPDADEAAQAIGRAYALDGWFRAPFDVLPAPSIERRPRVLRQTHSRPPAGSTLQTEHGAARLIEFDPARAARLAWVEGPGALGLRLTELGNDNGTVPIFDPAERAWIQPESATRANRLADFLDLAVDADLETYGIADWNQLGQAELAILTRQGRARDLASG